MSTPTFVLYGWTVRQWMPEHAGLCGCGVDGETFWLSDGHRRVHNVCSGCATEWATTNTAVTR